MRKTIAVFIALVTVGLWFTPAPARAQEASKDSPAQTAAPAKAKTPVEAYRLDFSFNEVLDGKAVNTRRYSMNLTSGEFNEIKIGTRVPVSSGNNQYQYLDVGTNIWAQLKDIGVDERLLEVRSEVSNLDLETGGEHAGGLGLPPVVRQIKINGGTLLVVGKPLLIGSVDDPNSKRQFQLEVMVTKLR